MDGLKKGLSHDELLYLGRVQVYVSLDKLVKVIDKRKENAKNFIVVTAGLTMMVQSLAIIGSSFTIEEKAKVRARINKVAELAAEAAARFNKIEVKRWMETSL